MSKPIASYSPFRRAGDTVYCSGQIPLIPDTGELLHGTITEEVNRAIDNLAVVLEQAGSGLDRPVLQEDPGCSGGRALGSRRVGGVSSGGGH